MRIFLYEPKRSDNIFLIIARKDLSAQRKPDPLRAVILLQIQTRINVLYS